MALDADQIPLSVLLAERERRRRKRIRGTFTAYCEAALPTVAPDAIGIAPHQHLLIDALQSVADSIKRDAGQNLAVFMPPGSAKTTYSSVLFPAWLLRRPSLKIIAASHTASRAMEVSADVQRCSRAHGLELGYGLTTEAKERWTTTIGSSYRAVGVGVAVTGSRADIALIDDPVSGAAAADSEAERENVWRWYTRDLRTRLKPRARVVLVMTRWHMDDLAGRILEHEQDWRVINLPAIATSSDDALGREIGEPLWADGYGYAEKLHRERDQYEREGNARAWSALYQQEPRPAEGLLFRVERLGEPLGAEPAPAKWVRAWDLAATAASGSDPDWTAGVKVGRLSNGSYVIGDVVRMRGGPEQVEAAILATARMDGKAVQISLPQDPGQAGKAQVLSLTKMLSGWMVHSSPETGSKETRAGPVAAQVNVGNVSLVLGPWNSPFREELRDFPTGRKDDQVDALSRAFAQLIASSSYTLDYI